MPEERTVEGVACSGLEGGMLLAAANGRRPFRLVGDKPVWGRDRPYRVEHLRLDLAVDPAERAIRGVATTTFRPTNDGLREAVFDAVELDVESVEDAEGRALPFTLGERELRIDLGRPRSARRSITTVVRYSARPRRGLYFNAPDEGYPQRPSQVWTQGQPEDSPHYFPCFDFPGEKFTTEMLATVPAGWTAVSNGRLEATTEDREAKTVTYHWVQEVPHPAYLVTLTAGEFDVVEDEAEIDARPGGATVPVQYYGPRGSAEDLRRAFGRTPEMVRFFSERIGEPYPYPKYATIAIADFIFGGMENTSATTMTDTLLHDERAHTDYVDAADSITAHELAHQWFGDLLTCREWSHGWLNESFATYFDALFVEHQHGHDRFRYDVWQKAQAYLQEDSGFYRRPIVENWYSGPIDIFDRHLYERGSVVLDMLRTILGDDLWWKAIRHYVKTHRASDVLTHDLQRAVENATGRNLDWFFDQWVWKGGHPEFKATYAWDREQSLATVTLEQTQSTDDPLTSIYRTPLEIVFRTARGLQRREVQVTERQRTFVFPLDAEPKWAGIDPAWRVLKTLDFAPGEAQLRARLSADPATGDPEAMGRIEAAKGLAKVASASAVDALRAALLNDAELDFVRAEVATALGSTKAAPARDALIAAAGVPSSRVRRAVAAALGNFRDADAARALIGFLGEGAKRGDESYYVQASAATALGKTLQPDAYLVLRRTLGRQSHNAVIDAGVLAGIGALRDPRGIEVLLDHTRWGVQQNARRAATAALGELAPFGEEADRVRTRERLEHLTEDPWLRVQLTAVDALKAIGDRRSLGPVNAVAERALDGRLRRTARVAARTIAEGATAGEESKRLRDQVEQLEQQNRKLADRLARIEARLGGDSGDEAGADGAAPDDARGRRSARRGAGHGSDR